MKMLSRKIVPLLISIIMIFTAFPLIEVADAATATKEKVSMDGITASASDVEANTSYTAEKAVDGNDSTRWAANRSDDGVTRWLQLNFTRPQTVSGFSVHWEQANITEFSIQTANSADASDENWTDCYTFSSETSNAIQEDEFESPVTSQFFRLKITGYTTGTLNWRSVSVYEFCLFEANVADSNNTHVMSIDSEFLKQNARSSSEKYPAASASADGSIDGYAVNAFDGQNKIFWHSRYGATDQRGDSDTYGANKIGDTPCDNGSDGQYDAKTVWLQTKISDNDEEKFIGGFTYLGRNNGYGYWKDFEVWISDSEDMENDGYILAYTTQGETHKPIQCQNGDPTPQYVYFEEPVVGKYIRFIINSVYHGSDGNSPENSNKYVAADNIEFLEINNESIPTVFDKIKSIYNFENVNSAYNDMLNWREFFTQESINCCTAAVEASEKYFNNSNDIQSALECIKTLQTMPEIEYCYSIVRVVPDKFTGEVKVCPNNGAEAPNNTETTVYIGRNTNGETRTVTISTRDICDDGYDIPFDGWYDGDTKASYTDLENGSDSDFHEYQYTVDISDNTDVTLKSVYSGTDINADSTEIMTFTSDTFLSNNARASSEQYSSNFNSGDGYAIHAFDGNNGNWWHSRYSGTATREENKIGSDLCDTGEESGGLIEPSENKSVWLQTKISEDDSDKLIGGFVFTGRSNGMGMWRDFEVWVSDDENMTSENSFIAYTTENKAVRQIVYQAENSVAPQYVYFDQPAVGKYVRFVIKDIYTSSKGGNGNNHAAANNIEFLSIKEDYISQVFSTFKEWHNSVLEWEEFYTENSITNYKNAVNQANNCGTDTQSIIDAIKNVNHTGVDVLEYSYTTVKVAAGEYVGTVTVTPDSNGKNPINKNSSTIAYIGRNTNNQRTVTLTVEDAYGDGEDLEFDGWYNGDTKVDSITKNDDGSYTYIVDLEQLSITLTAKYKVSKLSAATTHTLETDNTFLMNNAKASSEQYPLITSYPNDGYAPYAFNGSDTNWWHARYESTSEPRTENSIGEVICDKGNLDDGEVDPVLNKSVWLQTKISEESKFIGGFVYTGRNTKNGYWKDFEVWVSNSEDMDNDGYVLAYTTENKENKPFEAQTDQRTTTVYFDQPVLGNYVRFVVKEVYHSNNSSATGDKHPTAAGISFLEVNSDSYAELLLETSLFNKYIYDGLYKWKEFYKNDALVSLNSAIADARNAAGSLTDDEQALEFYKKLDDANIGIKLDRNFDYLFRSS